MTDIILLEPLEIALVHRIAQSLHAVKYSVRDCLSFDLKLLLNGVFHAILLRLCVIVVKDRHLVLHELRKGLATIDTLIEELRFGVLYVCQLE